MPSGAAVRFDGGHKRDAFLTETFGRFVEWVPVCPEVECGLGTPREAMRLVRAPDGVRLLTIKTVRDMTERMDTYAARRVSQLEAEDLSGYVLKKDSPSCGLERVKVYDPHGVPDRTGRGLFAARLRERVSPSAGRGRGPPVGSTSSGQLRRARVRVLETSRPVRRALDGEATLVRFHTAHKLIVLAHSPAAYVQLGRLVARVRALPRTGDRTPLHLDVHVRARGGRDRAGGT